MPACSFRTSASKTGREARSSSHLSFLMRTKAAWRGTLAESARRSRARLGITSETQVAVLIQELVPAEVAGVLFTGDPLSGGRDRWLVEASWGLGEAVVEGLVTPDRYTVAPTGELLGRQLGDKERMIVQDEDGRTHE